MCLLLKLMVEGLSEMHHVEIFLFFMLCDYCTVFDSETRQIMSAFSMAVCWFVCLFVHLLKWGSPALHLNLLLMLEAVILLTCSLLVCSLLLLTSCSFPLA